MPEIHTLESPILNRKRKVRVWLPPGVSATQSQKLPLLLLHDGQNCFTDRDDELPYGSWGVDEWLTRLIADGSLPPLVAVGVDNSPARAREYFPFTEEYANYKRFLLEEVLPMVRSGYPVGEHVSLMGSSMGGLVSFALAADRPDVFPAAACLSPWFEVEHNRYIHDVLRPMKEKPPIRVYFDSGIFDWRGLDDGHRGMLMARVELLRLGFAENSPEFRWWVDTWFPKLSDLVDSKVKEDKRELAMKNQHTEFHWRRRLAEPLRFLFG